MSNDQSENNASELLKKLLEQAKYQNQMLGNITNFLEVMICQLEKISKQTCESVNELHWQTGLQKSLLEDISLILDIYKTKNPEAVLRIKELEELKKKIEKCCPDDKIDKPKCDYDPCEKPEDNKPQSADLKRGQSAPGKVEGGHYEPVIKKDDYKRQPNFRKGKITPKGKFKGLISETKGSDLKNMSAGDDSADPVIFSRYTENTLTNLASANAADISGADSGAVVMLSGNWYVQYSTDGGQNFTTLNPTTIFPNTLAGGFCCDQIIQYVPRIDRFIWLLQYNQTAAGDNAYRIAAASPQDIINSNCTAWTYWDLTSASFNLGTDWMDYPSLGVGNNFIYLSCDAVGGGGLIVVRMPLNEIQSGSTMNFQYTNQADSLDARGGNVSQNTMDEVFWAGHIDNSTIRIWNMREGLNNYSWRDVDVNNWPNNNLASNGPNGNNWLDYNLTATTTPTTMGWQFPDDAVIGITRRGNELWLAWTASNGDGGFGGFNFPHPHVQLVKINIDNYSRIEQMQIWNPDHAFAYPSLATNTENEVGITLGWGGGGTLNANSAVGIMGDFVVWFRNGSTWTHTRWGDYVTVRQASPDGRLFAGFGYVIYQDGTTTAGHRFDPYYVLFGRQSHLPPPIG